MATYYFDGSDAVATDPNAVWTNETNADDGDTGTFADTTTAGSTSSNYLMIEGTNAPASGDPIATVRARLYWDSNSDAPQWSTYSTLTTATGGWTWDKVQALEVKIYAYTLGGQIIAVVYTDGLAQNLGSVSPSYTVGATTWSVARVELEVTTYPLNQTYPGSIYKTQGYQ